MHKMDSFAEHYKAIYADRWEALYQALLAEEQRIARWNAFVPDEKPDSWEEISGLQQPIRSKCYNMLGVSKHELLRGSNDLLQYYIMDFASVLAAENLDVQEGDQVLDMCAAPGGKSLVLIEALAHSGEFIANEMSNDRREKLKKVIQNYVPRDVRDRVWLTGKDGGRFAQTHPEQFDKILVDAPCSGEKHLVAKPALLKEWHPSRGRQLAQRQYALLTAALLAVKPGGKIVYSTCSISPDENDGVIAKLLKKKKDQFVVCESKVYLKDQEQTEYGQILLPDRCGWGPIYYTTLQRNA